MNIVITGALGHIGSALMQNLSKIKKLKKIYLIDNGLRNNLNVLFNYKSKKNIKFIFEDLKSKKSIKSIKDKIDVVIHLASITNAENSFNIKKELYENNLGIFKNVVNFCIKKKSKLIHISSTSVYGVQLDLVDEECKNLLPQSPYADVKLLEEKFLKKNKNKIKFISLRFGTVAGVSKGMRFHTAVNKFCFNAAINIDIPVWNNAIDQYRPYLALSDAIKTIIFFINKDIFNNQIYNVLTKNFTVRQILNTIKKNKYNLKIKKTNSQILNQNSYKVSKRKIDKLGLKLKNNINSDIKQTLKLFENLNK